MKSDDDALRITTVTGKHLTPKIISDISYQKLWKCGQHPYQSKLGQNLMKGTGHSIYAE